MQCSFIGSFYKGALKDYYCTVSITSFAFIGGITFVLSIFYFIIFYALISSGVLLVDKSRLPPPRRYDDEEELGEWIEGESEGETGESEGERQFDSEEEEILRMEEEEGDFDSEEEERQRRMMKEGKDYGYLSGSEGFSDDERYHAEGDSFDEEEGFSENDEDY